MMDSSTADFIPEPTSSSFLSPQSESSSLVSVESPFVDPERAANMLHGFSGLYEHKLFCDISLTVANQDFPCHKNVLAVSSPFFMAMFKHNLAESQLTHVPIKEIEPETMKLILDYVYTGVVKLTEETVQGLLSASNMFQMIALRTGCAHYMMKHVAVSNCIGVYFFAKAHHCLELANLAKQFIQTHFTTLCREQEFLMLPVEQLREILADDGLGVHNEEIVYESCLAWINFNMEERKRHLVDVMKCVRFAAISSYYFCDKIDSNNLLRNDSQLSKILDNVKYYHMLRNRQNEIDLNYVPRRGMLEQRAIVTMANPYNEESSQKFNSIELLLPHEGTIHHLCKLPQTVYMPGACVTGDNQIFLAGGAIRKINYRGPFSTEDVSPNFFMYDKQFGSWMVKAKMINGRSQFCLLVVDSAIIAIGGQNESHRLDSVERYDQKHNKWIKCAALPTSLRCMTGCSHKGSLYIFGGESETEIVKTAYRYDVCDDRWFELPPMKTARALAGCVVYRDKIYVVGGNSTVSVKWKKEFLPEHCISSTEIFDPTTGQWNPGPDLPNALCGAAVVKYGDTVMIVGGEDDKSWMAGTFYLKQTPEGREIWAEGRELPSVMSTFACVVANVPKDLLYNDSIIK